jgi:Pyridoxamine 5'-phosphate oxidase
VSLLSREASAILDRGTLCHVASATSSGPHVTPLVYAVAGDRLWVTTSRGSTKAKAWRRDDRVGGLVRDGERSVAFGARVRWHDALDPGTWIRSTFEAPIVTLAAARFTVRNARFFAGYAVDANHVPLAWTPPGRVFAELRLERWARFDGDAVVESWGDWPGRGERVRGRRRSSTPRGPGRPTALDALPSDVASLTEGTREGALALVVEGEAVVLRTRWDRDGDALVAAVPADVEALVELPVDVPAALEIDRAARWRAREMAGVMVRGNGAVSRRAGGVSVRLIPQRVVWWRGWDSGTVTA